MRRSGFGGHPPPDGRYKGVRSNGGRVDSAPSHPISTPVETGERGRTLFGLGRGSTILWGTLLNWPKIWRLAASQNEGSPRTALPPWPCPHPWPPRTPGSTAPAPLGQGLSPP